MGIFLGSNILKKGVSWRGFKGFAIFALGFYTHDALTPNPKKLIKEVEQLCAEASCSIEACKAEVAEFEKNEKVLDDLMQLYSARMAELKEIKKLKKLSGETI